MSLKFDFVPLQISVKFPIFDPFWGSRDCGCFFTTKGDRKWKSVGLCGKYYASRVTFATLDEVSWRFHQRDEIGNFIENRFFACWKIRVFDPPGGPPPGRCTVCAAPRPRTPPSVPRFARVLAYLSFYLLFLFFTIPLVDLYFLFDSFVQLASYVELNSEVDALKEVRHLLLRLSGCVYTVALWPGTLWLFWSWKSSAT